MATIAITCAVLLFAPAPLLQALHLQAFVAGYGGWLGGALVVSSTLLILLPLARAIERRRVARALTELGANETAIVERFAALGQRSLLLDPLNAAVCSLVAQRLLVRTGSLGAIDQMPYTLSEEAWRALRHRRG